MIGVRQLGLAVVIVAAACGPAGSGDAPVATTPEAREATRVTKVADLGSPIGSRAWSIEYASETVLGEPTTVSGWVAVPDIAQNEMPIVAWAHPTVGLDDACSPSKSGGLTPFSFELELAAGWAVVATDYEGLGGPGLHPYLVSESEARSIFDLIRAAQELDARVGSRVALWGFSQGGHAVLSAAGLAADLAPDLQVVGTAAVAPAVDLIGWPAQAIGTPQQGYIASIVVAFAAAYGLDSSDVLAPLSRELVDEIETSCGDPMWLGVSVLPPDDLFVANPAEVEPWASLLTENSPELTTIDSPVLLVVGDRDRLLPPDLVELVVGRMCEAGSLVDVSTYPGEGHTSVTSASNAEVRAFLADRFAGRDFAADC